MTSEIQPRVVATDAALAFLAEIQRDHPEILFHQSGGCCDGSAPMCYPLGDFIIGDVDVLLQQLQIDGIEEPIPFYMSQSQYEYWKHTHLTVDVVPGRGSGFSLEAPEGVRFLIRSRIFTEDELIGLGLL